MGQVKGPLVQERGSSSEGVTQGPNLLPEQRLLSNRLLVLRDTDGLLHLRDSWNKSFLSSHAYLTHESI